MNVRYRVARVALVVAAALAVAALRASAQCTPATVKLLVDDQFDQARDQTQALLKTNPSDAVALHCMGRVYMAMNKPDVAADWFERAIKANDKAAIHHLWLGNALGDQAQHASKLKQPFLARRIKAEFEKSVELDPTSIDARHGLIQFYTQAPGFMGGSMEKAHDQAREIEKTNPMRGHWEMAQLLENNDKDNLAAEHEYMAALAAEPDSAYGYSGLAQFYRRQKKYTESVAVWDRFLKVEPDAMNAHLNIAFCLAQSGQGLDRAEREVREWLAAPPHDASQVTTGFAHYVLGMIYAGRAKKEVARAEYQSALALNPKNGDAQKALDALK